ncbi:MAG: hypothetical protein ABSF26_02490 [Thermoguttaceae bacterium]|jgi:hypothetical protein
MASDLKHFLATQIGDVAFRPYLAISREGDALTAYFKPDADYSERLTDHVTLYRSIDSDEIVGCRIKGISGILEDLPNFLHVDHNGAKLSMVFWSFRGGVDDEKLRDTFRQLAKAAGDMPLQTA